MVDKNLIIAGLTHCQKQEGCDNCPLYSIVDKNSNCPTLFLEFLNQYCADLEFYKQAYEENQKDIEILIEVEKEATGPIGDWLTSSKAYSAGLYSSDDKLITPLAFTKTYEDETYVKDMVYEKAFDAIAEYVNKSKWEVDLK